MTYWYATEEKLKEALLWKEDWRAFVKRIRSYGDRFAIGTPDTGFEPLDDDDIDWIMGWGHCDFCGEETYIVGTHYGTSHYNRKICKKCIDKVNEYHKCVDGKPCLNDDGSYIE